MAQNDIQKKPIEKIHVVIAFLTLVTLSIAVCAYVTQRDDSSTQRFNTAWLLVNSSSQPTQFSAYSVPTNFPPDGSNPRKNGGRQRALEYLKDSGESLQGAYLSQSIISYIDLNGKDLNRVNMENADIFGSDLTAASMWGGQMKDANLQFARLQGADLENADLACSDLRGAHLEALDVDTYLNMPHEGRYPASLHGALYRRPASDPPYIALLTWWIEQNFETFQWRDEQLHRPMAESLQKRLWNNVHNEYLTDRVIKYAVRRESAPLVIGTNLTEANLTCAHLEGADLTRANLVGAKLINAHLENYTDTFDETPYCTQMSKGLLGLDWYTTMATKPTPQQLCDWASTHPERVLGKLRRPGEESKHIILPKSFLCAKQPEAWANIDLKRWGNTHLTSAILTNADLEGAVLTNAILTNADLEGAILTGAIDIKEKQIGAARLCHTILPADVPQTRDRDCSKPRKLPDCTKAPRGNQ